MVYRHLGGMRGLLIASWDKGWPGRRSDPENTRRREEVKVNSASWGRARAAYGRSLLSRESSEVVAEEVLEGIGASLGVGKGRGAGRNGNRRHTSGNEVELCCACMYARDAFSGDGTQRVRDAEGARRAVRGTEAKRSPRRATD